MKTKLSTKLPLINSFIRPGVNIGALSRLFFTVVVMAVSSILMTGCSKSNSAGTADIQSSMKASADANAPKPGDTGGNRD